MSIMLSPLTHRPLDPHSRALLHWRPQEGPLAALTRQKATFSRASGARARAANGALYTAVRGQPRMQWTDGRAGLLIELQRTNSLTRSEELDNAAWSKTNVTISPNSAIAPDGNASADKIVENTTSNQQHRVSRSFSATNNAPQALSCYARRGERAWLVLQIVDKAGAVRQAWFDLLNGDVGTSSGTIRTFIEAAGPDSWRCAIVATVASGGGTPSARICTAPGDGVAAHDGVSGSGLYVWGVSLEVDCAYPTSYVPTIDSTVTRSADAYYLPFHAAPRELTAYVRFIERGTVLESGAGLLHVGNAAGTGQSLRIVESGGFYRASFDNGSAAVHSTLGVAPVLGARVELRAVLARTADGLFTIQLHQSIDGTAETSGAESSAVGMASAWSDERCYLNSIGSGNAGAAEFRAVKIGAGVQAMDQLRSLF